jgi:hypothetical protein
MRRAEKEITGFPSVGCSNSPSPVVGYRFGFNRSQGLQSAQADKLAERDLGEGLTVI